MNITGGDWSESQVALVREDTGGTNGGPLGLRISVAHCEKKVWGDNGRTNDRPIGTRLCILLLDHGRAASPLGRGNVGYSAGDWLLRASNRHQDSSRFFFGAIV